MLAQHRAYHPRTGRFLSPDPLGLAGGMFRTRYAEGDGVNLVDPTGWLTNGLSTNDPSQMEYKDDEPTTGTSGGSDGDGAGAGKSFCSENAFACGGNDAGGGDVLRKMLILRQDGEEAEGEVEAGPSRTRAGAFLARVAGRLRTEAQNRLGDGAASGYDDDGTPMATMEVWSLRGAASDFTSALTHSPLLSWIQDGGPERIAEYGRGLWKRNTSGEGAARDRGEFGWQTLGEFLRMMADQLELPREENPILATSSPYHMVLNMAADAEDAVHSALGTSPKQMLNEQSEQLLASTVQIDPNATLAAVGFMAAVALATPGPQGELNLASVRASDVVTLWKAPVAGRLGVADEIVNGFDKGQYPGMGPFFSTERAVAEKYQHHYRNGLQEINVPRTEFERLVGERVIRRDGLEDASWHVPSAGLDDFNKAILTGPSNIYHPE